MNYAEIIVHTYEKIKLDFYLMLFLLNVKMCYVSKWLLGGLLLLENEKILSFKSVMLYDLIYC